MSTCTARQWPHGFVTSSISFFHRFFCLPQRSISRVWQTWLVFPVNNHPPLPLGDAELDTPPCPPITYPKQHAPSFSATSFPQAPLPYLVKRALQPQPLEHPPPPRKSASSPYPHPSLQFHRVVRPEAGAILPSVLPHPDHTLTNSPPQNLIN